MDEEREQEPGQQVVPGVADLDMQTLAAQLVAAAGDRGIELTGTDGLLTALTAPYGARLAHRLDRKMLRRAFAVYLLLTALSVVLKAL